MLKKYANSKIVNIFESPNDFSRFLKFAGKGTEDRVLNKIASIPLLKAEPENFIYLRNRSISALESWGCNQNYDGFPSDEIQKSHGTFKNCGISVDHINNNTDDDIIGIIVDSIYVPKQIYRPKTGELILFKESDLKSGDQVVGDWVENLLAIDKRRANIHTAGLVDGILKGEVRDTSMGCSVKISECSICHNMASREEDFCEHVKYSKGKFIDYENRRKLAYEINHGLDFFEDSIILSHEFALKAGKSAKAGGEGADARAKIIEVVAGKKEESILDYVKKTAVLPTIVDNTVTIGAEPPELADKREEYEKGEEEADGEARKEREKQNAPIIVDSKKIEIDELTSIAKESKNYNKFKSSVIGKLGLESIASNSEIKLKSFYNKFKKESNKNDILAITKGIIDREGEIPERVLRSRLDAMGYKKTEIDEALAYQTYFKGANYDVSAKLKEHLIEGMRLYNSIDKKSYSPVNEMPTPVTGDLPSMVDRYHDEQTDEGIDPEPRDDQQGYATFNGTTKVPQNNLYAKKTAILEDEILQFVKGFGEKGVEKENILSRFGFTQDTLAKVEALLAENKVTEDDLGVIHINPDTTQVEDVNLGDVTTNVNNTVTDEVDTEDFDSGDEFIKYISNPNNKWILMSASNSDTSTDDEGKDVLVRNHPLNQTQTANLKNDIIQLGYEPIPVLGKYMNQEEESFFIKGMELKDAVFLGYKYKQHAIYTPQGNYIIPSEVMKDKNIQSPNSVTQDIIEAGDIEPANVVNNKNAVLTGAQAEQESGNSTINIGGQEVTFAIDTQWGSPINFNDFTKGNLSQVAKKSLKEVDVEKDVKSSEDIKDDANFIKETEDENLEKTSKDNNNSSMERFETKLARLKKQFGVNTKDHLKDSDSLANGTGNERYHGNYNDKEQDLSPKKKDLESYKDLKEMMDAEFRTNEKGMVQKKLAGVDDKVTFRAKILWGQPVIIKEINGTPVEKYTGYGSFEGAQQEAINMTHGLVSATSQPLILDKFNSKSLINIRKQVYSIYEKLAVVPEGWEGTVKKMKGEEGIDNPYALTWWMKNKGDKSHYNENGTNKKSHLSELGDENMIDSQDGKDTLTSKPEYTNDEFGFDNNDEILDTKNIKGNLEEFLKEASKILKTSSEDEEPEWEDRVSCKDCGNKISDSEHDDNGGRCNDCSGDKESLAYIKNKLASAMSCPNCGNSRLIHDEEGDFCEACGWNDANNVRAMAMIKTKLAEVMTMDAEHPDLDTLEGSGKSEQSVTAKTANVLDTNEVPMGTSVQVKDKNTNSPVDTGMVQATSPNIKPDGSQSTSVTMGDGKTYSGDEFNIEKTSEAVEDGEKLGETEWDGKLGEDEEQVKEAKKLKVISELENMDFGDSEKLSKLAEIENMDLGNASMPSFQSELSGVQEPMDNTAVDSVDIVAMFEPNEEDSDKVKKAKSELNNKHASFKVNYGGSFKKPELTKTNELDGLFD